MASPAKAGQWDISGQGTLEARYFPHDVAFANQSQVSLSPSLTLEPEFVFETKHAQNRFTIQPFIRWDADDDKRSHVDVREFNWLHLGSTWDFTMGISKVYWGVTESAHLVDIINQTDAVEGITGEEKLGQAMLNLNSEHSWGNLSMFILPGFRERSFTANNARLHGPLNIDASQARYASSEQQHHTDWALRWSHMWDDLDIALSHFQGTSREPRLLPIIVSGQAVFIPYYDQIQQTGLELQLTTNNTLWKTEVIHRQGQGKPFYALVAGFEHTLYALAGSDADVGLLFEYLYDDRDPKAAPPTIANRDIFAGLRMVLNDTQDTSLLLGVLLDLEHQSILVNIEAERRLTNQLKLVLSSQLFNNIADQDILAGVRQDDVVALKLHYYY
ncbi:MAG: hypothetical protein Q9M19_06155 [Mariprofundaceae bacterium]|nr:hypothetical protein [Mariprofundaceae bacterium]